MPFVLKKPHCCHEEKAILVPKERKWGVCIFNMSMKYLSVVASVNSKKLLVHSRGTKQTLLLFLCKDTLHYCTIQATGIMLILVWNLEIIRLWRSQSNRWIFINKFCWMNNSFHCQIGLKFYTCQGLAVHTCICDLKFPVKRYV